ncbi:MAG: helix-turn-helix domain-containing protein [Janthinobacterium lividum]
MMVRQRIEVVASKSGIITHEIRKNLDDPSIQSIYLNSDYQKTISNLAKIDLLIVDADIDLDFSLHHVKTLVNLTRAYTKNKLGVCLIIPTRLADLLDVIKNSRTREQLFCIVNDSWFYDERLCQIFKHDTRIGFTEKENKIFRYLILSTDNIAYRKDLLEVVWQYHPDINSATIESHIFRLKQKLPKNSIEFKDNYYRLITANII